MLLTRLLGAAFAIALLAVTAAAQPPGTSSLPFVLKKLGPGVYAAIDGPGHEAGSNSGFVIGDDGVLVVDAFFSTAAARALIAEIRKLTPKPIRYVVNTHYHLDHTAGDSEFREAGAIIIAHRNARGWLRTENLHLLGDRLTPELRAAILSLPLPDITTSTELTLWLGARRIVVAPGLGHTGGDLTIFVPDAGILFCGDLLWRRISPNLIDASVHEWIGTEDRFLALPHASEMTFVPGHGDVAGERDVREFRAYLVNLERLVTDARRSGVEGPRRNQAISTQLRTLYPEWEISDRAAAFEIRYMDEELAGTKRRPSPQPD